MVLVRNDGRKGELTGRDVSDYGHFAGYLDVAEEEASEQWCEWAFVDPLHACVVMISQENSRKVATTYKGWKISSLHP